jgi:nucleoside diphosphate kinase
MEHELEELGLKVVDRRLSRLTEDEARQLYDELRQDGRPWYEDAVRAILRGPVVAFLVEGGDDAVAVIKEWRGPTFEADQTDSFRGRMIRAHGTGEDESLRAATNYVHSSGGDKEARHEASILFPEVVLDA